MLVVIIKRRWLVFRTSCKEYISSLFKLFSWTYLSSVFKLFRLLGNLGRAGNEGFVHDENERWIVGFFGFIGDASTYLLGVQI